MKKLKYVGPSGTGVEIDGVGATDENGVLEVLDDEVAKSLLKQDVWEPADKSDQKKEG